jgi:hypothetical protein
MMNMSVWNPFREMENMFERYHHATGEFIRALQNPALYDHPAISKEERHRAESLI